MAGCTVGVETVAAHARGMGHTDDGRETGFLFEHDLSVRKTFGNVYCKWISLQPTFIVKKHVIIKYGLVTI